MEDQDNKLTVMAVRLPRSLIEQVQSLANHQDRTISELVGHVLQAICEESATP